MSKYKKKSDDSLINGLIWLIDISITLSIKLAIYIVKFIIYITKRIIYFFSDYRKKSSNSFEKINYDKGSCEEYQVYKIVSKIVGKENVLVNIYLPSTSIDTTEIDILGISDTSIYIFEVKNYSGYIFGSEDNESWTQVLNKNTKNKFYNPIKQNKAHVLALQNIIPEEKDNIVDLIVFSNKSNIKNVNTNSVVLKTNNIKSYIKGKESIMSAAYSNEDKQRIISKLKEYSLANDSIKQKHIEDINNISKNL